MFSTSSLNRSRYNAVKRYLNEVFNDESRVLYLVDHFLNNLWLECGVWLDDTDRVGQVGLLGVEQLLLH
jgi:hypothetical protein